MDRYHVDSGNPLLRIWSAPQRMVQGLAWPLVLYGSAGVGKTVLAETLLRQVAGTCCFLTGGEFRRQFFRACATRSLRQFLAELNGYESLLLDGFAVEPDDSGLERSLIQLLDNYLQDNRPVVVTTSMAPFVNERLSPALQSRLSAGLSIPVTRPGAAARNMIVRQLLHRLEVRIDPADLDWLVGQLPASVPAISRILTQMAIAAAAAKPDDVGAVWGRCWISDFLAGMRVRQTSGAIGDIIRLVARHYGLKTGEITGSARRGVLVQARGVVAWLARTRLSASYPQIGLSLGKRDASTVRHAVRRVDGLRQTDSALDLRLHQLGRQLESRWAEDPGGQGIEEGKNVEFALPGVF